MKELFGTDGLRGAAGDFPLDKQTANIVGASLARQFREQLGRVPRFVSGRDTRESGSWLETAVLDGAMSENAACESAGVITTPGVAYLTGELDFDAGIVISASHNPYNDNGIKIFLPSGKKMDSSMERAIERDIYAKNGPATDGGNRPVERASEFADAYLEHLRAEADGFSAGGLKILVDCANGAASGFAAKLFESFGLEVITLNDKPDGRNINENCGSTHIEHLPAQVLAANADLGVAFDGDADRALFVDENGDIVDGDATLWIMAQYLISHGKLANSTVVATVMSNIGLEKALDTIGVKLLRTDVGDKYVLEKLLETDSEVGGEQSGHLIFPQSSLVGDGMMTALRLIGAIVEKGVSLSQAKKGFNQFPQILLNARVAEKRPFQDVPEIVSASAAVENALAGEGRLLLRYSGTENLARVMIEGADQESIEAHARHLIDVIKTELG